MQIQLLSPCQMRTSVAHTKPKIGNKFANNAYFKTCFRGQKFARKHQMWTKMTVWFVIHFSHVSHPQTAGCACVFQNPTFPSDDEMEPQKVLGPQAWIKQLITMLDWSQIQFRCAYCHQTIDFSVWYEKTHDHQTKHECPSIYCPKDQNITFTKRGGFCECYHPQTEVKVPRATCSLRSIREEQRHNNVSVCGGYACPDLRAFQASTVPVFPWKLDEELQTWKTYDHVKPQFYLCLLWLGANRTSSDVHEALSFCTAGRRHNLQPKHQFFPRRHSWYLNLEIHPKRASLTIVIFPGINLSSYKNKTQNLLYQTNQSGRELVFAQHNFGRFGAKGPPRSSSLRFVVSCLNSHTNEEKLEAQITVHSVSNIKIMYNSNEVHAQNFFSVCISRFWE